MRKKAVLFILPVFCLVMVSGLLAEKKPVSLQDLFENLPPNIIFHDSNGFEYNLSFAGNWGDCITYTGYAWIPSDGFIGWPQCYFWMNEIWSEFGITGLSNNDKYGFVKIGDAWTDNTYVLTHGYVDQTVQFFKGPIPAPPIRPLSDNGDRE